MYPLIHHRYKKGKGTAVNNWNWTTRKYCDPDRKRTQVSETKPSQSKIYPRAQHQLFHVTISHHAAPTSLQERACNYHKRGIKSILDN